MKGWLDPASSYHHPALQRHHPVAVARTTGARCGSAPCISCCRIHGERSVLHGRGARRPPASLNTSHLLSWIWKDPQRPRAGALYLCFAETVRPQRRRASAGCYRPCAAAADHSERKARPMFAAQLRRPGSGWLRGFVSHYHVVYSSVDPSPRSSPTD
jgi:hypothetical protein